MCNSSLLNTKKVNKNLQIKSNVQSKIDFHDFEKKKN